MEELDLLKIERFVFQVYEHFLLYWSTLTNLFVKPSTVLDSLEPLPVAESDEAADPRPEAENAAEPQSSHDSGSGEESRPTGDNSARSSGSSKTGKWSLLPGDFLDKRRNERARRRRIEAGSQERFAFEVADEDERTVCLPGLFALFSVLVLFGLEWAQMAIMSEQFEALSTSFGQLQVTHGLLFVTLFLVSQFIDAFFSGRGTPSRPRQIFALCCYCTGFLVPKAMLSLGTVVFYELEMAKAMYFFGALSALIYLLLAVFWMRGVRLIYGAGWVRTFRGALNAALGSTVCYALLAMAVFPDLFIRNFRWSRILAQVREGQYARALEGCHRVKSGMFTKLQEERIRRTTEYLQYFVYADRLVRLEKLQRIIEAWKTDRRGIAPPLPKRYETLLAVIDAARALFCDGLAPHEGNSRDVTVRLAGAEEGTKRKITAAQWAAIPHPLPEGPLDVATRLASLKKLVTSNTGRAVKSSRILGVAAPHSRSDYHLFFEKRHLLLSQALDVGRFDEGQGQEMARAIEALYWEAVLQQTQYLQWFADLPEQLVSRDELQ